MTNRWLNALGILAFVLVAAYQWAQGSHPLELNNLTVMLFGLAAPTFARIVGGGSCMALGLGFCWAGLTGKQGDFRYGEGGEGPPMPERSGKALFISMGLVMFLGGLLWMAL